uniref:Uncharacterized protein n=1 Tax=Arundo donax TaxID=35708 RepID=A0A0A9CTY9_ARUDO
MLPYSPQRLGALPTQLCCRAIFSILAIIRKISMILMHYSCPGFLQFHLCPLQSDEILENLAILRQNIRSNEELQWPVNRIFQSNAIPPIKCQF